ncbi:MAG: hypothetical protein AUG51_16045 [Acidobacteria bacterium 13_1_20CM_3_53_8]|nr:MAG: hypothetical protein AUG51_16045 [Acidobacteria bacterium 13_1_20CM_3_53_8]
MQIFISYAREDYETARRLFDTLKTIPEVQPWLDKESLLPGAAWEEEILRAIDESHFVILILSDNSINKEGFVQKEIGEALNRFSRVPPGKIFIIPARISDCIPKHRELQRLNWVDLFANWDEGVNRIVKALSVNRPADTSFEDYITLIKVLNPKALPIIESHPKGNEILRGMYALRINKQFPRQMSVDGEIVHNPIYEKTTAESGEVIEPLIIGGALESNIRIMLLDLYLIKAIDNNGQPLLLQYYSGTESAGWKTWLFPHGLNFQRSSQDVSERMRLNAKDFEVTAGLAEDSVTVSYVPRSEYLISIKPDFGYKRELVLYCFLFCSVDIDNPPDRFLQREFEIPRGHYPRRFRWFYFEELQNDMTILSKNSDIIKAIHTIYAASLVPIKPSLKSHLRVIS